MKINIRYFIAAAIALNFATACKIDEVVDPNNPTLDGVLVNATKTELRTLVTGLEARNRNYYKNATEMFGSFAREVWPFFASDPRFFSDWLGTDTYPDFFAAEGTYFVPYQAIKQANVLIGSVENTAAVNDQEAAGYSGFAKTIKGFQLLHPLMQQYQNGIRVDVANPLSPGPRLDYDEALQAIRDILDDGLADLQAAGSTFDFTLTMGYDSPSEMIQVNRAIAARAALYANDFQGALDALNNSFMNLSATTAEEMNAGPILAFGNDPDISNPLFYPLNASTNTILIVHPSLIEDLEQGDARGNKFFERTNPVVADDFPFTGDYQDARWESNTSSIPFIRNEELILIKAEAEARKAAPDFTAAIDAINVVRNTWGLGDYTDASPTANEIIEQVLNERRFSLWAEGGHRWIDLRRTSRLNPTYVDLRDRDDGNPNTVDDLTLIDQISIPTSETNWDANN